MRAIMKSIVLLVAVVVGIGAVTAVAGEGKGSENKGRYFFKQNCKQCHTKGAEGGEITPLNKTIAQWHAYFLKGTHNKGKEPLTKYLPADQLKDAQAFLEGHAADSLQPETCGKN